MGVHVSSQINLTHERHTAIVAGEWLKPFVLPTVRDQIGRLAERLATEVALVGLLSRVYVRVLLHVGLLVEFLATELTLERTRV